MTLSGTEKNGLHCCQKRASAHLIFIFKEKVLHRRTGFSASALALFSGEQPLRFTFWKGKNDDA